MCTLGRRIDFGEAKMYSINELCEDLVYFVCFALQNAILSQLR